MMAHPEIFKILQDENNRLISLQNEERLDNMQRIGDKLMLALAVALAGVFGCIAYMAIRGY